MSGEVVREEGMTREDVFYYSDGLKITAHFYRPESWRAGDPPLPAVVCLKLSQPPVLSAFTGND